MNKKGDIAMGIFFTLLCVIVAFALVGINNTFFVKTQEMEIPLCGIFLDGWFDNRFEGNFKTEQKCFDLEVVCEEMGCNYLENSDPVTCYCIIEDNV